MSEKLEAVTGAQVDEDIKAGDQRKGDLVSVRVDGTPHTVRRGVYKVADFKRLVGVDPAYQLDEVIHGEFKELKDEQSTNIKGGEVFVSHVRGGNSSHA